MVMVVVVVCFRGLRFLLLVLPGLRPLKSAKPVRRSDTRRHICVAVVSLYCMGVWASMIQWAISAPVCR